jgi:hypothetical protein
MPIEAIIPLPGGLFGVTPRRASSPYCIQYIRKLECCKISFAGLNIKVIYGVTTLGFAPAADEN